MSSYIRVIYDRLDFIEFKQNLILLKQPQHKASVFYKLTLDDFLKIRDLTLNFENQIKSGARTSISDYESELFEICPLVKTYPSASTLIAKVLMSEDVFNSLFSSSNYTFYKEEQYYTFLCFCVNIFFYLFAIFLFKYVHTPYRLKYLLGGNLYV